MQRTLLLLLIFITSSAASQTRRFEIAAGFGNNGQIQKSIDNYFYYSEPLFIYSGATNSELSRVKYNITAKLNFNEHVSVRIRYGNSRTHEAYDYLSSTTDGRFIIDNRITNINPALCFTERMNRMNITAGIEFAFYRVGDFKAYFNGDQEFTYYFNSELMKDERYVDSETRIGGGKATGINGLMEIEYLFSKRFSFGTGLSYGMVYTKLGNELVQKERYVYNNNSILVFPPTGLYMEDRKLKEKQFGGLELNVFLSFRFGKVITEK